MLTGRAAHICAAAPGGPRHDPDQTDAERRSYENGIWLCERCAWTIDKDAQSIYSVVLLKEWRRQAEAKAAEEHGERPLSPQDIVNHMAVVMQGAAPAFAPKAIAHAIQAHQQVLEALDPRLAVEVAFRAGGRPSYVLRSRSEEPFAFGLELPAQYAPAFNAQLQALWAHGDRLELACHDLRLTGSEVFDRLNLPAAGLLTMESMASTPAAIRLRARAQDQTGPLLAELHGQLTFGQESATFVGNAFDGLLTLHLRFPFDMAIPATVNLGWRFDAWFDELPQLLVYFEDFKELWVAIASQAIMDFELSIKGNRCLGLAGPIRVDNGKQHTVTAVLHVLDLVRRWLRLAPHDIRFSPDWYISEDDVQHLAMVVAALEGGGSYSTSVGGGTARGLIELERLGQFREIEKAAVAMVERQGYELVLGAHTIILPRIRQSFDNARVRLGSWSPDLPPRTVPLLMEIGPGRRTVSIELGEPEGDPEPTLDHG